MNEFCPIILLWAAILLIMTWKTLPFHPAVYLKKERSYSTHLLAYKKIIQDAKGKKTVFFVSQRDDFIKIADRVIVLTPGIRPAIMDTAKFINQYGT